MDVCIAHDILFDFWTDTELIIPSHNKVVEGI